MMWRTTSSWSSSWVTEHQQFTHTQRRCGFLLCLHEVCHSSYNLIEKHKHLHTFHWFMIYFLWSYRAKLIRKLIISTIRITLYILAKSTDIPDIPGHEIHLFPHLRSDLPRQNDITVMIFMSETREFRFTRHCSLALLKSALRWFAIVFSDSHAAFYHSLTFTVFIHRWTDRSAWWIIDYNW